jgi:hypothetical protein
MEAPESGPKLEPHKIIEEAVKRFPELPEGTFATKLARLEVLLLEAGVELDPEVKDPIKDLLRNHVRISAGMETFDQTVEQDTPVLLADVSAIREGGIPVETREDIKNIVELPLLRACEELYDKNIRTLASSANKKDIESGEVHILVDFDTLSEENKAIARQHAEPKQDSGHWGGGRLFIIKIPVSESTTVEEISTKAVAITNTFKKQSATWIRKKKIENFTATIDQLREGFFLEGPEYDDPNSSVWDDLGYDYDPAKEVFYSRERAEYYYDPQTETYYTNEEHYKKANEGNHST